MRLPMFVLVLAMAGLIGSFAWAGEMKCHVTRSGVDVDGATVTLAPGGASKTTGADGVCVFHGLAAGNYRVEATRTFGAMLYAVIKEGVAVPATGGVLCKLALERAIHISRYLPLTVGNFWQYKATNTDVGGAPVTKTRRERVVGTDAIAGETVSVVEVTWSPGGDGMKQYAKSSAKGHARFREAQTGDTVDYAPPMRFRNLWPSGYSMEVSTTFKHSDGSPDQPVKMKVTLVGFQTVTVPAGTFVDCARLECEQEIDGAPGKMTLWLAKDVGTVRSHESSRDKRHKRVLEEYKIVRPAMILKAPTLKPPLRPFPRKP